MTSPLTVALLEQLVRTGVIDADDIHEMATRLDEAGDTDDARICRATFFQASAPTQAEWEAQQRRSRFEVVPDGGNCAD